MDLVQLVLNVQRIRGNLVLAEGITPRELEMEGRRAYCFSFSV